MTNATLSIDNIEQYLEQHQKKELLRFVAVGSVDDGKSTLIGRLLHDTKGVYEDQLSAVKRASSQREGADEEAGLDFSLFTDGLRAEREQGITIDVAYRYFSTEKRKFIIADTPGHVQYTRNMATGASTANVGIILIDARLGVLPQSRRHAYIASLLGIPRLAVAVNKMDLCDYQESVFERITADFGTFAERLGFRELCFIPISAKRGDNVVHQSASMPWFKRGTLLEYLENVPVAADRTGKGFRFPVQHVIRPNLDYRGYAGEIASGSVSKGDSVMVLPSRTTSRVVSIDTFDGELDAAHAGLGVTLRLADEIDVSRGDMLVHPEHLPSVSRRFRAHLVWLGERKLDLGKSYLLKHTTQLVRANVDKVLSVIDLETLSEGEPETLELNDIGRVQITCHRPIFFDAYAKSRSTGAFVLIDSITNNTVAAGMIEEPEPGLSLPPGDSTNALGTKSQVSVTERAERVTQTGGVIHVQGELAGTLCYPIERALYDAGKVASVIDTTGAEPAAVFADGVKLCVGKLLELGAVVVLATPASSDLDSLKTSVASATWLSVETTRSTLLVEGEPWDLKLDDRELLARRIVQRAAERGWFLE